MRNCYAAGNCPSEEFYLFTVILKSQLFKPNHIPHAIICVTRLYNSSGHYFFIHMHISMIMPQKKNPKKESLVNYWKETDQITDDKVIEAFKVVPRENFILPQHAEHTYSDFP